MTLTEHICEHRLIDDSHEETRLNEACSPNPNPKEGGGEYKVH